MVKICKNCKYFVRELSIKPDVICKFHCRKSHPTTYGFPETEEDGWCGEFEDEIPDTYNDVVAITVIGGDKTVTEMSYHKLNVVGIYNSGARLLPNSDVIFFGKDIKVSNNGLVHVEKNDGEVEIRLSKRPNVFCVIRFIITKQYKTDFYDSSKMC